MIKFKEFLILNEKVESNDEISISITNADQNFTTTLIDKFSLIIMKRSVKSVRPNKISGSLNLDKRSTITIIMNNKDLIIGIFSSSSGNVAISVNNEIIYDVDKKGFDDNKLVDKMSEEYIKYLKNKGYKIKYKT